MLSKITVLFSVVGLAGCAQFHGAGKFKTGADYPAGAEAVGPGGGDLTHAPSIGDNQIELEWPVSNIRVTQSFEPSNNRKHKGIDIGGSKGSPILAAQEGKVIYRGRGFRGYGNMVLIEHGNEWATLYAHLQKIKVKQGQTVAAGAQIGTMGRTGRATGVHLHFELMKNKEPVDPIQYLRGNQTVAGQARRSAANVH
jgi:murein DD-endopeptidase MepM/ murein hydrolase activator NlpD